VEIDWDRSAWWWYPLSRAIQPAVRMLSLALSLIGLWVAGSGVAVGEWLFRPRWANDDLTGMLRFGALGDYGGGWLVSPLMAWLSALPTALFNFEVFGLTELAFVLFVLLWLFSTCALFGAVLARRAAVELGQRTVATWSESFWIVGSRWQSYFWATGMHLVGLALLLLPVALLGLLSRLGTAGAIVAGVLLLLSFPLVFAVGRFALSAIVCFPLSVCAISVEKKADAFEGFSRSNAYFFQRPVLGAVCGLVLLLFGVVGEQIVYWTLSLGWGLVRGTFNVAGNESGNYFVEIGDALNLALIIAYWFSFFWSASAALYLILRRSVDNCELDVMEAFESELELSLPNIPTVSQPLASAAPSAADSATADAAPSDSSPAPASDDSPSQGSNDESTAGEKP
jgi:hypothetical protein